MGRVLQLLAYQLRDGGALSHLVRTGSDVLDRRPDFRLLVDASLSSTTTSLGRSVTTASEFELGCP